MQKYKLIYYELENGRRPAKEFVDSQDEKMGAKITFYMDYLKERGPLVRMPYSRAMGKGLFELRIISGNNIARILYFFCKGNKIILTNGFIKKTQKTPASELELARKYKEDYERRNRQ